MDIVITNIGQLITPVEHTLGGNKPLSNLQITSDTSLYVRNGRITDERLPRGSKIKTVDANGGVVLPGLIDPFWVMPTLPAWIHDLPELKLQSKDLLSWSLRLLNRSLSAGVTTLEMKCPHDSQFAGLAALGHLGQRRHPRVIGTLLETLPDEPEDCDRSMSSLIGDVIPEVRRRRLATFCDIGWGARRRFVDEVRSVLRAASGAGLRPKLCIQSPSQDEDVLELALSVEVAAIACASHLSLATVERLFEGSVIPVYLPALPGGQGDETFCVRTLLDQGVRIGIGSGNGLLADSLQSMWAVLASTIDRMKLSLSEAIIACTLSNAMAIEMSHEVGSLEQGKRADLIVLDLVDYRELGIVSGFPPVSMVMIDGEIVHSV